MTLQRLAELIELGRKFVKEDFATYLSNYMGVLEGCPMGMAYVGQLAERQNWNPVSPIINADEVMITFRDDKLQDNYASHDGSFMIADKLGLDRTIALSISFYHAGGHKSLDQILEVLRDGSFSVPEGKEGIIKDLIDEAADLNPSCGNLA